MANKNDDNSNRGKKRTYASNAILTALFVIGAIVVVNLISTRVFGRLDLTEAKMYTISDGSKQLVKNLPDYLTVKVFMTTEDLPPELKSTSRYVRDLVDEYKTASNGKFRWEAIDPSKDKKLEEEASRCKVEKVQVQVLRQQKFELGAHYMGLCLQYGDQIEAIPQIARIEGLEYQVTSLIKKLTQKKRKVVFTTGHGEADTNQGFQALKADLEKEYEVTSVNPSSAEIAADVDALVVGGPKQAFDEKGQKEIDKFLMRGKGAIFLVDGMTLQSPGQQNFPGMDAPAIKMGQANETGLGKLLETYGFKVNQDFVFDDVNVPGPIPAAGGRMMIANLPYFVAASIDDASENKGFLVLDNLRGVVFPYPSSVELVGTLKGGKPAAGKLWKLASSSPESWKHTGFLVVSPTTKVEPGKDLAASALGYAYEGPLKSAFPGAAPDAVSSPEANKDQPKSETQKARIVVVGDSDFANDEYVGLARHPILAVYATGAQLLFNAIAWAAEDETLTPLRGKNPMPRPLKTASDAKIAALQWGNIIGLPLAFCAFGVARWRVRRAARQGAKL